MIKRFTAIALAVIFMSSCTFVPENKLETEPMIPGSHGEKIPESDPATETPDCSIVDPVPDDTETTEEETDAPETETNETGKEPQFIDTEPTSSDVDYLAVPEAESFEDAVTLFSEAIYKNIISHGVSGENVVFSPISVMYALSLIGNGADCETYEEFSQLFGGFAPDELNAPLHQLKNGLESTEKTKVKIGNAVWVNGIGDKSSLSEDYINTVREYYDARIEELLFDDAAKDLMNKWVSEMTDGMIDEAIDYLDPELVMILMNTVLFDGKWVEPFDEELTSEDTFHNYDGSETTVSFMHSSEYYSYFELDGAVGMHKQYKDGYKFIAVLPEGDINEFIAEMDVSEIVGKTRYSDMYVVDMSVPKFDYKFKADLNEILMGMGLGKAFISSAEFNNLFSDNDRNVLISSVSQQAKIIMNEGGTKAAAYTEVDAAECEHIYVDVVLNKPFFYMIVDKDGIPLFMGTIYNFTEQ